MVSSKYTTLLPTGAFGKRTESRTAEEGAMYWFSTMIAEMVRKEECFSSEGLGE